MLAAAVAVLAACGSSSSSGVKTTDPKPTSSSSTNSTPSGSPGGSSASGTVKAVDVTITGDKTATIQGTKGGCQTGSKPRYLIQSQDYPALGSPAHLEITGAPSGITLTDLEAARVYHDQNGTGITISSDHKKVTLDAALSAVSLANGATYTAHLTGTITCR